MARRKQGKKKRAAAGLERRETGARAPASGEREAEQARSGKLFWWPLAIVLAVVVIVFFTRAEPGPLSFPPAVAGNANAEVVVYEDFAGSDACAGCHAEQFQMWESSTHGRAGGLPSSDVLITAFDGRAIRFKDAVVYPRTNSAGQYLFTVQQDNREPFDFVVAGVVGGGHMYGGGTQGFLSAYPDGTLRFLPFDFIRIEGVWFCNTNTRTNEGWIPITREMLLRDCG
ncbi:MAG: cytochrome c family protein, partial [Gemmatimonadota bacterium]|nr:cytochrome c family protein [Gemmatimonadota bacterium]